MKTARHHHPVVHLILTIALLALLLTPAASAQAPTRIVAQLGGASYAIAVTDELICAGLGPNLMLFSTAASGLAPLGSLYLGDIVRGIAVVGDHAYVAATSAGLRIVSLANPAAPLEIGARDKLGAAQSVAITNGYAYVGDAEGNVHVLDIHDPTQPALVGSVPTLGEALDIEIVNSYAYVADGRSGLCILSLADPLH
ncbi:MAG: LVIVD repeat-containing protein, partial [Anaerolineae bacterium]